MFLKTVLLVARLFENLIYKGHELFSTEYVIVKKLAEKSHPAHSSL